MKKYSMLLLLLLCLCVRENVCANSRSIIENAKHPVFSTSHWGLCVVNPKSKETVYSYNATQLFIPASVTKLFTAASALETLGPSHVFDTSVKSSSAPDKQGRILGNLYLVGGADPTLDSQALHQLAKRVYDSGVREILGTVIVDDSCIGGPSLPTHAEWEDIGMAYAAEICSLNINDNVVRVIIHPNASGSGLAEITIDQDIPYCQVLNHVRTDGEAKQASLSVSRGLSNNVIEIKGVIPSENPVILRSVAVHQPQEYARTIFLKALQNCGISIQGKNIQSEPAATHEIAHVSSVPLSAIIAKMNKVSHNLFAELLFKYVNRRSDKPNTVHEKMMERLSIKSNEYLLNNGSLLSRHNLVTPQQTVKLLEYASQSSFKDVFMDSLPIGGVDGRLSNRFKDIMPGVVIRAKTGSMSGISNLAGFIQFPNGKELIFAIFINNSLRSSKELKDALDALLAELVRDYHEGKSEARSLKSE